MTPSPSSLPPRKLSPSGALRRALLLALSVVALAPGVALADDSSVAVEDMVAAVAAEPGSAGIETNPDVHISATASVPVVSEGATGDIATLGLPTTGSGVVEGGTTVFEGTAPDTQVGVQPTAEGFRALVRIESADAPERYDYVVGNDAAQLREEPDGSISVLNAADEMISHIATPWARDANGVEMPTHYEIEGLKLTQVVEHRAGFYAYPVVADPFWSTAWKVVKCTAAIGAFIAGNLFLITKVRRFGGIARAVDKLRGASNYANRYKAALSVFGEVSGISGIVSACG